MSTNSNIHVLNSSTFQPATTLLKSLYPPDTSSTIETKEVKEYTINLLLNLKVKR